MARIVGIGSGEWDAVKAAVNLFFKPSTNPAGFLVHSFCQEALSIHDARINNSRMNGKKGGRPNLLKNKANNPAGSETITQQNPDNRTEQSKVEKEPDGSLSPPRAARSAKPPVYSPEFDEFWQTYPRNNGEKFESLKSYLKARKDTDHGRIIEGARAYRDHCGGQGAERRYIKHASTWLNARGWETDRDSSQPIPGHRASGPAPGDGQRAIKRSQWEVAGANAIEKIRRGEL